MHIPFLSGWLDNELKISNSFLDDDVDDLGLHSFCFCHFPKFCTLEIIKTCVHSEFLNKSFLSGFDPFHETQKGLADLLESEAAEAQQSYKVHFFFY